MSQRSVHDQRRAPSQSKNKTTSSSSQATYLPSAEPPPPISYVRIGSLVAVARADNLNKPYEFSEEAIAEIEEEWGMMVGDALARFDNRLTCGNCSQIHMKDQVFRMLSALKLEMEGAGVEDIDEGLVRGFQRDFEEIWRVYLDGAKDSDCDDWS
ncbi:uncharacterized protein LY89DRAFT_683486 [Mollisia scopiformis]|uniref:Uncharacterized protein n=1 Tax=Mollisia scopiformis TaxID=149040 RepID=A0A194XFH9_MOLSC|nr:uncharacterized protein LY89DRAFT_683486 [Mollisia scopiformis]KUJ18527.1 hypothetical protein LY89DRAFT_683486 [Mollisia scopiformis]